MRWGLGYCRGCRQGDRRLEHHGYESSADGEGGASCSLHAGESAEVPSYFVDDPIWWVETWPSPQAGATIIATLDVSQAHPIQVWFAGAHSDVGGGYERHETADISLFWMAVSRIYFLNTLRWSISLNGYSIG